MRWPQTDHKYVPLRTCPPMELKFFLSLLLLYMLCLSSESIKFSIAVHQATRKPSLESPAIHPSQRNADPCASGGADAPKPMRAVPRTGGAESAEGLLSRPQEHPALSRSLQVRGKALPVTCCRDRNQRWRTDASWASRARRRSPARPDRTSDAATSSAGGRSGTPSGCPLGSSASSGFSMKLQNLLN